MRRVNNDIVKLVVLWILCTFFAITAIAAVLDPYYDTSAVWFFLAISGCFMIWAIVVTRRVLAFKKLKENAICYDAVVVELIKTNFSLNGRRKVFARCAFLNEHGENRIVTGRKAFFIKMDDVTYQLGGGGFQKIRIEDELAAKVYVNRDDPEDFVVELYWR